MKKRYWKDHKIILKTQKEIEGIRAACVLTAEILDATCAMAKAGVTTRELNDYAHQLHVEAGVIPAPLNYGEPPFPASICTSVNEVICHGIPDDTPLADGDIINIDVSIIKDGYFGDCSRMVPIGAVSNEKQLVMDVAYESLMRSISILKPGLKLNSIGSEITAYAHANGCSGVEQFVGHGVGLKFHENPQVLHCRNYDTTPLAPGMTFTIEPMINAGTKSATMDPSNGWVARTSDGRASAQWEHTVVITDDGYEILTPWKR
jgi:methionyl aminopeptidase